MNVEVHTFGPIRETVGQKVLSVSVPQSATVADVLATVESEYPDLDGRFLDDDALADDLTVTLDGTAVQHLDGLETPLEENAVLRVTPPIVGG